jgi:hypothetical protein
VPGRLGRAVLREELPCQSNKAEHNALLHLFSASEEQVEYGAHHYRQRSEQTSTLLNSLFERYRTEGLAMPYTMEDFQRDYIKAHFKELTPAERHEILKALSPEERLEGLSSEERLEGLSPEEIERILKKRKAEGPSGKREPRGGKKP